MKKLNKILSVGLSLIMCASMTVPALAASFDDLQNAINGSDYYGTAGSQIGDTGRYGYGQSLAEDNSKYEIEAWDDGGNRNVQLNANVEFSTSDKEAGRDNNGQGAIWVWRPGEVSIDLNGHNIDMNPGADLDAETGKFYDKTGAEVAQDDLNKGTVLIVSGGNLTITDSEGTGRITGGNAWGASNGSVSYENGAGAVYVDKGGSFTMEGGSISGNLSYGPVICAENTQWAEDSSALNVTLNGVTVENNYTQAGGTIYFRAHAGTVNATIEDCTITGNVAEGDVIDFGIYDKGQSLVAAITNTTIMGNKVDQFGVRGYDHGGIALWQGEDKDLRVTIDGCTIQNNDGGCTGIYYSKEGKDGLTITDGNNTICGNARQDYTNGVAVKYQDGSTKAAMHTDAYWENIVETTDPVTIKEATDTDPGLIRYFCPHCKAPYDVETPVKTPAPGTDDNGGSEDPDPSKDPDLPETTDPSETPETPSTPVPGTPVADIPVADVPAAGAAGGEAATTTIEDDEVPLADIFTRADAIGYLWEQTGSPEWELSGFPDVPEDHEWAVAIGWAEDMGIALPDEDGNFRPDDLVLRSTEDIEGEFQEFLNRYAVFAGIELEDGELFIELEGLPIDFITRDEAEAIFDMFFAKLEAALEDKAA